MPTLILLDSSLSMNRPVTNEHASTRLALAKDGLDSLIIYFQRVFPLEYVGLMSFSSACVLLNPFTRDHAELHDSLSTVLVNDRSNFYTALETLTEVVIKEWGLFVPIQVVLVTDGLLSVRCPLDGQEVFPFPFPCQFHIVPIATKNETTYLNDIVKFIGLNNSSVFFPQESKQLSSQVIQESFRSMAKYVFHPYSGLLTCGHLHCNFSLSPSPKMTQTILSIARNSHHKYINPYVVKDFPGEMVICGFLDINVLLAPAVYSKHFVIDSEISEDDIEKAFKEGSHQQANEDGSSIKTANSNKPSFRVLLHGSLKCESKVAVIQLGDNWFALLSSAAATSKKSNLILTVLFPNAHIPWLGHMIYLGPKMVGSDPRLSDGQDLFPVSVPHTLSYQAPTTLYWAKESGLQNDFTKLLRYSHKLPEKEASLIKELNKLRLTVLTYSIPNLMEAVCHILDMEESATNNPQARAILQRCIQFLTTNQNPHDKLTAMSYK